MFQRQSSVSEGTPCALATNSLKQRAKGEALRTAGCWCSKSDEISPMDAVRAHEIQPISIVSPEEYMSHLTTTNRANRRLYCTHLTNMPFDLRQFPDPATS